MPITPHARGQERIAKESVDTPVHPDKGELPPKRFAELNVDFPVHGGGDGGVGTHSRTMRRVLFRVS